MISPNGLYGYVPLPHATEFELAVALIWYTLYSCIVNTLVPLCWYKTTTGNQVGLDKHC